MNQASQEVIDQIICRLPRIGMTLSQEEADAIKEYIHKSYFTDDIQGAVHSGWTRHEKLKPNTDETGEDEDQEEE